MNSTNHSWQRVLLHTMCLCRRPDHARFHLQGIAREMPLSHLDPDHSFTCADAALLAFSAVAAIGSQIVVHYYS